MFLLIVSKLFCTCFFSASITVSFNRGIGKIQTSQSYDSFIAASSYLILQPRNFLASVHGRYFTTILEPYLFLCKGRHYQIDKTRTVWHISSAKLGEIRRNVGGSFSMNKFLSIRDQSYTIISRSKNLYFFFFFLHESMNGNQIFHPRKQRTTTCYPRGDFAVAKRQREREKERVCVRERKREHAVYTS